MKNLLIMLIFVVSSQTFAQGYDSIFNEYSEEDIFVCNHILSVAPSVAPESVECIRVVKVAYVLLNVEGDHPVDLKDVSETLVTLIENYPSMRAVYLRGFNG